MNLDLNTNTTPEDIENYYQTVKTARKEELMSRKMRANSFMIKDGHGVGGFQVRTPRRGMSMHMGNPNLQVGEQKSSSTADQPGRFLKLPGNQDRMVTDMSKVLSQSPDDVISNNDSYFVQR